MIVYGSPEADFFTTHNGHIDSYSTPIVGNIVGISTHFVYFWYITVYIAKPNVIFNTRMHI